MILVNTTASFVKGCLVETKDIDRSTGEVIASVLCRTWVRFACTYDGCVWYDLLFILAKRIENQGLHISILDGR